MFKLWGIDEAIEPVPQLMVNNSLWEPRGSRRQSVWEPRGNRKQRRALKSSVRRLSRAVPRAARTFDSPQGEQARIHVADLWKAYARVSGDVSVL